MEFQPGCLVEVRWVDSLTLPGWVDLKTAGDAKPVVLTSRGLVAVDREDAIVLTTTRMGDAVVGPLLIPKASVVEIKELTVYDPGDRLQEMPESGYVVSGVGAAQVVRQV